MALRYLIPCLIIYWYSLPAELMGQCDNPDLFPSILVGRKTCDSLTLTAINAEGHEIMWSVDGVPIPGGTEAVLLYAGEIDRRTFSLEVRSGMRCGSDREVISIEGRCPHEVCGNGLDDDGDGLTDLQDTEDCSCGGIPELRGESLIPNGSFERRRTGNPECEGCYRAYWQLDCVQGWEAANAPSSIEHVLKCYANGLGSAFVNYTLDNNASFLAARVAYDSTGFSTQETARVKLITPTVPGERYRFSLLIDIAGGTIKDINRRIQEFVLFGATEEAEFPFRFRGKDDVQFGGSWRDWTEIDSFSISVNNLRKWQYVEFEFIAPPNPLTHLVLTGKLTTSFLFDALGDYTAYYVMDNVVLERILDPLTLPDTLVAEITVTSQADGGADPCLRRSLLSTPVRPGYQYQWYRNDIGIPEATSPEYPVSSSTTESAFYRVGVYKDGVCRLSQPVVVEPFAPFTVLINVDGVSCTGAGDGRIALTLDPPISGAAYVLTDSVGDVQSGMLPNNALELTGRYPGKYSITISDSAGCERTESLLIKEPPPLLLAAEVLPIDCNGEPEGGISLEITGGTPPYALLVNDAAPAPPTDYPPQPPGSYRLRAIDSLGCRSPTTELVVIAPPPFTFEVTASPISVRLGESVSLDYRSNRILNSAVFSWAGLPDTLCADCPRLRFLPLATATYVLTARDEDGCVRSDSVTVDVKRDVRVYFPTAISPNGDGQNDAFRPYFGPGVRSVRLLQVFDRWGGLLFEGQGEGAEWNGMQAGVAAGAGNYLFSARLELLDGRTENFTGSFILLK